MQGRTLISEVLSIPIEDLPEPARIENIFEWDSIAHMHLIMRLEAELGRELTTDEILSLDGDDAIDGILKSMST